MKIPFEYLNYVRVEKSLACDIIGDEGSGNEDANNKPKSKYSQQLYTQLQSEGKELTRCRSRRKQSFYLTPFQELLIHGGIESVENELEEGQLRSFGRDSHLETGVWLFCLKYCWCCSPLR